MYSGAPRDVVASEPESAQLAPAPFSLGLLVFAAMSPAGREGRAWTAGSALVRFRCEMDGEAAARGELGDGRGGGRGIDFVRDSALRDKDMPSLIGLPCLGLFGPLPRNGDIGRVMLRPGRAIARSADGVKRRLRQGRALVRARRQAEARPTANAIRAKKSRRSILQAHENKRNRLSSCW